MIDYSTVTETPGARVSREAIDMVVTRYQFAGLFCAGKDVLEVACGAGQGLSFLAEHARRVVGGDLTLSLVQQARSISNGRAGVLQLDAHALPFAAGMFDAVLLFEALYYLSHPLRFVAECRRILRPRGVVLICSVNPEWADFNPSAHSVAYLSADEIAALLGQSGFSVDILGAFHATRPELKAVIVSGLKRAAVAMNIIPKTMKGKERLKRAFFGPLESFPASVTDSGGIYHAPQPLRADAAAWKVLYAVGRMQ